MDSFLNEIDLNVAELIRVFDVIDDLVFVMEANEGSFRYVYVNQSGLKELGIDEEIIIGSSLEEIVLPNTAQRLLEKYREVTFTKKTIKFEETIKSNHGRIVGETSLNPLISRDGQCNYVVGIVRDVTKHKLEGEELKKAKDSIERSQKKLTSLVENNEDAVFELDLSGNFRTVNDSITRITGYKEEELIGKSYAMLIVEEELTIANNNFKNAVDGYKRQYELLIYNNIGRRVLLSISIIPIINDGVTEGIYGIAKDITEERKVENELIDVKNQLELVWNNTSDAIFLIAQNGSILTANPSFETMFGFSLTDVQGIPTPPIFPTHEISGQQPFLEKMKNGEYVTNLEVQRLTKDGRMLDILASYRPINEGDVLAVAVYRDNTERNRMQSKLEESEKRYRSIVELSPEGIIIYKENKIMYMNKAGKDMLGITEEDVVGKSVFKFIHPDEKSWFKDLIEEFLEKVEQQDYDVVKVQQRLIHSNGEVVYTEVTGSPIEYKGELAIQAIFRDISERKKHEEQLTYLAFHDSLTGLKNRRAFMDSIEISLKNLSGSKKILAIVYLDMDDFKKINDDRGHDFGDQLLKQFAYRLKRNVREDDLLCRMGGDEFVICLQNIFNKQCVEDFADRLHVALQEPYFIKDEEVNITSSFGISLYPKDGVMSKMLIHRADKALYDAKQKKNKYSFYCS